MKAGIVHDEVIDLAEDADVKMLVAEEPEMSAEDQAEFEAALAESTEQLERGEFEEARPAILRLLAKAYISEA